MDHKKVIIAGIFTAALICGCTGDKTPDRGSLGDVKEADPTPTAAPTEAPTEAPTPTEAPKDDFDLYGAMSEWEFEFSSGAGGWATTLNVNADGSFSGQYHDSEMGATGPGYPNGSVYYCGFSGHFSGFEKLEDYKYAISIGDIEYENEPGTDAIKDGINYIYTEPYGLGNQSDFIVYLPGCSFDELAEGYVNWMTFMRYRAGAYNDYFDDFPETLYHCGFYNPYDDCGFYSYSRNGDNVTYLVNNARLPGLTNTWSQIERDGSYDFRDIREDGTLEITNCSFALTEDCNIYLEPGNFVDICLDRLGANPNKKTLNVYSFSYNTSYPYDEFFHINGETAILASWTEGSNEDTRVNLARISNMTGGYNSITGTMDPGYAYVYEVSFHPDYCPFSMDDLMLYISSLDFSGVPDKLSSASDHDLAIGATCYAAVTYSGSDDTVNADPVELIYYMDTDKLKEYGIDTSAGSSDYYIGGLDDGDEISFKLAEDCAIYIQTPENPFQRLMNIYEYTDRLSKDPDGGVVKLFFNSSSEVVMICEVAF